LQVTFENLMHHWITLDSAKEVVDCSKVRQTKLVSVHLSCY